MVDGFDVDAEFAGEPDPGFQADLDRLKAHLFGAGRSEDKRFREGTGC